MCKCKPDTGEKHDDLLTARRVLEHGTLLSCLSVLLMISGMSITYPHMQSRRDELGCDSLCYGTMTSVRSALGLAGTAFIGRLSDKNSSWLARSLGTLGKRTNNSPSGRRACLFLGTIASLIGLAISLSMNSLLGLWLSFIPDALLQHNFDVFKALLSEYHNDIELIEAQSIGDDSTTNESKSSASARSGSVGKLGMALGISFMIGPMIASVSSPTFQFAASFAIVCTIASGIVIFYLPMPKSSEVKYDKNVHDKNKQSDQVTENEFALTKLIMLQTVKSRAAMMLLVIRLSMALAYQFFNTIWPASLKSRFNFGPSDHARFMSFIGISYAFSQGFLAKRLVQFCGQEGKVYLIMSCCAILGVGRYIAYFTESLFVMYTSFLFIINALGTMNTVITADTGSIAPSHEIGALFGILSTAESAAGIMGPILGGLVSKLGKDVPLIAVIGLYGGLFAFVSWGYDYYITSKSNDLKHEGSIESKKTR